MGGSDKRQDNDTQNTNINDNRQDNSVNIDGDFLDDDSISYGDIDLSDRSIRDNSDRSVRIDDNSDNRVIDNSDRSIFLNNEDSSTRTDNSVTDNSTTINTLDGGAIDAAFDGINRGNDLAFAFASDAAEDAFDFSRSALGGAFDAVGNILRDSADANARGDAAQTAAFTKLVDSTRTETAKSFEKLIMVGGVVAAVALFTRRA